MIRYKDGYKYQLVEDYWIPTSVFPDDDIITPYISLNRSGALYICSGYAWDGPSGPTIDTKNFMRGSLVHDALYQLMREERLSAEKWRKVADQELVRICKEDGMSAIRAWWVYQGVRIGGGPSASKAGIKPVLVAP